MGRAIDLDEQGAVYVTGQTSSNNLPTTPGSFQPTRSMPDNTDGVFLVKFDAALTTMIYGTHIDTPGFTDDVRDIAVHNFCAYLTGSTGSDAFPVTPGVVQPTKNGAPRDIFVLKLSADGSSLVFSTFFGGDNLDIPYAIAVDIAGFIYVVGDTSGFNWPTSPGAFATTRNSFSGGFALKLNPDATSVVYSTYLSEGAGERPEGVAPDSQGATHIAGVIGADGYPVTPDAMQPTRGGERDAFYTVLSADGTRQKYSSYHGGAEDDMVGEVQGSFIFGDTVEVRDCQAYFVGRTASPGFPLMDPFQPTMGGGEWDAFISKVDPSTADGTPQINCTGVVLATGTPVMDMLAPRSIGTVFGSGFSTQSVFVPEIDASGNVSTNLANTCVEIAGQRGAMFVVVPTQINFMVPPGVPLGWRRVVVIRGCGTANEARSEPQYVEIKPVVPAFFNFINNLNGVNPIAAVDNATGFLIGPPGLFGLSGALGQNFVTTPAQPGQIIVVFPTGLGPTNPALANGQIPGAAFPITGSSSLTLGGVMVPPEDIFYVGAAPCCAGLDQVTFRVPATLAAGNHPLVLTVDGVSSPVGPFIAVQP